MNTEKLKALRIIGFIDSMDHLNRLVDDREQCITEILNMYRTLDISSEEASLILMFSGLCLQLMEIKTFAQLKELSIEDGRGLITDYNNRLSDMCNRCQLLCRE